MTATNTIRIVLDIELVDESPTGHVTTTDGCSRKFTGWLSLLSALDSLLATPSQSDDAEAGQPGERRF